MTIQDHVISKWNDDSKTMIFDVKESIEEFLSFQNDRNERQHKCHICSPESDRIQHALESLEKFMKQTPENFPKFIWNVKDYPVNSENPDRKFLWVISDELFEVENWLQSIDQFVAEISRTPFAHYMNELIEGEFQWVNTVKVGIFEAFYEDRRRINSRCI